MGLYVLVVNAPNPGQFEAVPFNVKSVDIKRRLKAALYLKAVEVL
jgi:hypothetical protein